MASRDLYPQEILQVVLDKSCAKAQSSVSTLAVLSVLAGGYIGFGYLAYLKVVSGIPHEWGGLATLLGAAMFPIALICILLGGGELDKQYDDYVFGAFGRADFHKNAAAQLGRRVSGQFGGNAGDGVLPWTLRRHDRRQRGGKNDCGGGSQSPYGFRQGFRLGGRV